MTLLPTITFGGQQFYDISGIVRPDRATRPLTDGIALHHSVGQTEFPDLNANGTSLDEQIAHVKAIDAFHVQQGYGGFGYTSIGFRDGTVMTVGKCAGQRAHVANQNHRLAGHCMAGTFTDKEVPVGMFLGAARVCAALEKEYGVTELRGHQKWVAPQDLPQWATACPGSKGLQSVGNVTLAKLAILRSETAALDAIVRANIANAIRPAAEAGDLTVLANQIKYITGGRLCGI